MPCSPGRGEKGGLAAEGAPLTEGGKVDPPCGPEQMVAIAVPSQNPPIDFGILAQPGLETRRSGDKSRALSTPLGQLLESAMYRVGGTRGVERPVVEGEMGIRVLSWRTEPAAAPPPK